MMWAHGFRSLGPWLLGPSSLGLWWAQDVTEGTWQNRPVHLTMAKREERLGTAPVTDFLPLDLLPQGPITSRQKQAFSLWAWGASKIHCDRGRYPKCLTISPGKVLLFPTGTLLWSRYNRSIVLSR